jgi:hypothetical protein
MPIHLKFKRDSLIKDVMTPINLKGASTEFTIFRQRTSQYSEALNSVIYFATLPYKLQDASVNRNSLRKLQSKISSMML